MNLGIVVPCRNEAVVVERRIANLALVAWPAGAHRIVIVDDGSEDDTAALARAALARVDWPPNVDTSVVANARSAGKPGAIATGLDLFGSAIDLVCLTDADVVVAADAFAALVRAFERRPGLAMACGAQRFVRALDPGGAFPGSDGAPSDPAGGLYDALTAAVRRFESQSGRLFSVHGQLLAWRRALALVPAPGIAADDLDLRLQVRARSVPPRDVALVADALFAERKEAVARDTQALRRARAYVQTIVRREPPRLPSRVDRVQLALYRRLPLLAPWLALALLVALPLGAALLGGWQAGLATLAAEGLSFALPLVRRCARLCAWIVRAAAAERRSSMGDRWEMARR